VREERVRKGVGKNVLETTAMRESGRAELLTIINKTSKVYQVLVLLARPLCSRAACLSLINFKVHPCKTCYPADTTRQMCIGPPLPYLSLLRMHWKAA